MAGPRQILITGGTAGIGLALAERLSSRHRILVTGRKLSDGLKTLIEERPDVEYLQLDQENVASICGLLTKKLEKKGWERLDNVVLNAGFGYVCNPTQEQPDRIRSTLNVNLTANIALAHCLYPYLSKEKGKLTFIGSTARTGAANFATYAASKAALHGLARALKEEWRSRISVQILHPGPTKTDMHAKAGLNPGKIRSLFIEPDAMAQMIEHKLARNIFSANLGMMYYWTGGQYFGRALR